MAGRQITFGLGLWPFPYLSGDSAGRLQYQKLFSLAEQAEQAGYDSIWTSDSIGRHPPRLDTFLYLTALAMRTKRVKLGTCVLVTPLRHPISLTRTVNTLDLLSEGRFLLGVGTGWVESEFRNFGVPFAQRGGRTTEVLEIIKRFWTEHEVTHTGRYYQFERVTILPKPVQEPHPPILIGGNSEAAYRRIVALGDGWVTPSYVATDVVADGVRRIKQLSQEAGRDFDPYVVAELNVNIAPSQAAALEETDHWHASFLRSADRGQLQMLGGSSAGQLASTGAVGPPDVCIQRVRELIAAGAHSIMFRFIAYDWQTQFDRLTDQVLPYCRP